MKGISLCAPAVLLGAVLTTPALAQEATFLSADMFGALVPGGGVDAAVGDFNGELNPARSQLCYYLEVADLADADGVGIYKGPKNENGTEVLTLALPKARADEVCVPVAGDLLQAMRQAPADYYVSVRNASHPNGAIRGQFGG
jgi:hypothetical protein